MFRIEAEQDLETLRQVALLLDDENRRLIDRIRKLTDELARLRGDGRDGAQLELQILQELEEARKRLLEARQQGQEKTAATDESSEKQKSQQRCRRGHGPRQQPQLPVVEWVHELEAEDRCCPACGGEMGEMGALSEDSEEITVVERRFVKVQHRRKKYRCRCNGAVATAPGPPKLIPGGRYSVEFAVDVAVSKYLDHLPLERQVRRMEREGLQTDSQTLWDQIDALARHLEPCYESLRERVLASPVIHADETGWRLLDSNQKSNWSVWGLTTADSAFYRILSSKSVRAGRKVLSGYEGIVVADGYKVYEVLARAGPKIQLAHCWAHVRRRFAEIQEMYPQACGEILGMIKKLYEVERLVPDPFPGEEKAQALRLRLRQQRSRPVVARIREWAFSQGGLPRSELGKGVNYLLERWAGLTLFLENPLVPLDNNPVERALRRPVVGRKNHYGSRSKRGTEVAALFYSLCETAALCGVDARFFLIQAARRAIKNPGAITLPQADGLIRLND